MDRKSKEDRVGKVLGKDGVKPMLDYMGVSSIREMTDDQLDFAVQVAVPASTLRKEEQTRNTPALLCSEANGPGMPGREMKSVSKSF
jgi:hypothetical protein